MLFESDDARNRFSPFLFIVIPLRENLLEALMEKAYARLLSFRFERLAMDRLP
jgi:hypothetical protein